MNPNEVSVANEPQIKESLQQLQCKVTVSKEPVKCNLRSSCQFYSTMFLASTMDYKIISGFIQHTFNYKHTYMYMNIYI